MILQKIISKSEISKVGTPLEAQKAQSYKYAEGMRFFLNPKSRKQLAEYNSLKLKGGKSVKT